MNRTRLSLFAGSAALLLAAAGAQTALSRHRPVSSPALAEGILSALGGVRSLIAEVIWFRADRLQDEGRYVELAELASALTAMEPHTPEVWSYAAWNLAYNISVAMPTYGDRWRWVHAGLKLLRDRGLPLNPHEAELYRELAWMFQLKIGADIDSAAGIYRQKWKAIVEDVRSRGAWSELGMDETLMREIEKASGFTDWTDAQLSAIYWAVRGLRNCPDGQNRRFLAEIARQASVIYLRNRGEAVPSPLRPTAGASLH